jgi:sugar lactone lactonase YvrE
VDEAGRLHVEAVTGTQVVTGPDGSTYVAGPWTVDRHYPDGTVVPVLGYGPSKAPVDGQPAISAGMRLTDVAISPDGELYVAGESTVFRIDADGRLDLVLDRAESGMAAGPDGTLYLADYKDNRVLKVSDGEITTFAGTGSSGSSETDLGDGGPATEAIVVSPYDVEVAADGTVYVSSPDGIRRIATDGTIETILHPAVGDAPDRLALDGHGNLYFTEPDLYRVRVVVAAGEIVFPGFGWDTLWLGVNLAVAAFVFVEIRRRRLLEEMLGKPE